MFLLEFITVSKTVQTLMNGVVKYSYLIVVTFTHVFNKVRKEFVTRRSLKYVIQDN